MSMRVVTRQTFAEIPYVDRVPDLRNLRPQPIDWTVNSLISGAVVHHHGRRSGGVQILDRARHGRRGRNRRDLCEPRLHRPAASTLHRS